MSSSVFRSTEFAPASFFRTCEGFSMEPPVLAGRQETKIRSSDLIGDLVIFKYTLIFAVI